MINQLRHYCGLLQSCGVIRDDCDARSIRITWSDADPDPLGGVRIVLEAA